MTFQLNSLQVLPRQMGFLMALLAPLVPLPTLAADKASPSDEIQILEQTSQAFQEVAKKAIPAVVSITADKILEENVEGDAMTPFGFPDPHSDPGIGIGSGAIIRSDGIILTNNHVVENSTKITVSHDGKKKWKATLIGADPSTDVALLKITDPVKDLPVINFGNSNNVQVGDWAIAIGAPFGLNHSVTSGIISATGRAQLGAFDTENFIQTDAAINPGNSGGPLLNLKGEMIGINTAIFSQSGGFIGIGFSIPSNLAEQISTQILKHGKVTRGWMGVVAQDVDDAMASYFKISKAQGAVVSDLAKKSPADLASLKVGDVILKFDGKEVKDTADLKEKVGQSKAGHEVKVEILRASKAQTVKLKIQERPEERPTQLAGVKAPKKDNPTFGLTTRDVPKEYAKELEMTHSRGALIIGVDPGSLAYEAGLMPGDVILKLNNNNISNSREFEIKSTRASKRDVVLLYVQRGPAEKVFIPLQKDS